MLKAKDKQARRGNWITFAIVLALTLITMVLENVMSPGSLLFTVIKKGAVYSLVAVSMNLLNGFTGLFSLGQAGFMLLGAYAYAIFMIPEAAREGGYNYFATTLTVSPHKNAPLINAIGEKLAEDHGVLWLPSDFKKRDGYRRSIELSHEYGLYRQSWCGCGLPENF